jgi:hypothetical protein
MIYSKSINHFNYQYQFLLFAAKELEFKIKNCLNL